MAEYPLCIGLTGSVGMGKSEAAKSFTACGLPVFDADKSVHELYHTAAVAAAVERAFPGTTGPDGVDREKLSVALKSGNTAFSRLEAVVHPFVVHAAKAFIAAVQKDGGDMLVLDVPLLYEAGWDRYCDIVVVVSAPARMQRERVLLRAGMTEEKMARIMARQMPDEEKRLLADYVIDTSGPLEDSRAQIRALSEELRRKRARG